jgi:hypothetical protein
MLNAAGFKTVGEVREASDAMLLSLRASDKVPLINFKGLGPLPMMALGQRHSSRRDEVRRCTLDTRYKSTDGLSASPR